MKCIELRKRQTWVSGTASAIKLGNIDNFSGSHMPSVKGDVYFMVCLL